MAEAFGILRVDPSLLVAAGLIQHAVLFKAKGFDGLALRGVCRDFASGTVIDGPLRLLSRAGFLRSATRRSFASRRGVGLVGMPSMLRLAGFPLGLGVDPFADAVELNRALGWRRVEGWLIGEVLTSLASR